MLCDLKDEHYLDIPKGRDVTKENIENFWSDLSWRTLHCLIELKGELFAISDFAEFVGISVAEIVRALEGMESIGLIEKTDKGYKTRKANVKMLYPPGELSREIQDLAMASHQITDKFVETSAKKPGIIKSVVYTSTADSVNKLNRNILKCIEDFKKESDQGKSDGVYSISYVCADLLMRELL